MRRDAELHAEEDRKRKEEVETRNRADELVYTTEKSLRDLGDKVEPSERQKIEAAVKELKDALAGSDVEKIKSCMDSLVQASHKLAEAVYAQAAAAGGASQGGGGTSSGEGQEEVVDADYEVMDDEQGQS